MSEEFETDRGAEPGAHVSARWARWRAAADLDEYASRWQRQAAAGDEVHGEADLVSWLEPTSVLDAGCGAGRVAIELARRGIDVVGVDLDDELLAHARRLAPGLDWRCHDLATMDLGRRFDVVVLAGNVVNYCRPEDRSAIIANAAAHLEPGGRLVAGYSIEPESDRPGPAGNPAPDPSTTGDAVDNRDRYLLAAHGAGLEPVGQWATWDRQPFDPSGGYVVVMHRHSEGAVPRSSSDPGAGGPGPG